jgi:hypothetical protein
LKEIKIAIEIVLKRKERKREEGKEGEGREENGS